MCQFSSRPRNWATHPPRWEVDIVVQLVPCKIYLYTQVLDSRREDLEKYLQYLAKIEPLPFELSEFLNLEGLTTSSDSAGCSKNARPFKKYFFSHYLLFYFIYFFFSTLLLQGILRPQLCPWFWIMRSWTALETSSLIPQWIHSIACDIIVDTYLVFFIFSSPLRMQCSQVGRDQVLIFTI